MTQHYLVCCTGLAMLLVMPTFLWASQPVYFSGEINQQAVETFLQKHNLVQADTLYIDSGGGEVEAGIRLGLWLYSRDMDVVVKGRCLSSCANYVFTAGKHKTVTQGSVVAWHGNYHHLDKTGLWRDDVALRMRRDGEDKATASAKVRSQVDHLVSLEKDFFARVGVNEYLCWVGKRPPFTVANYYTLSAKDMASFGLQHISLPDDYWQQDFSRFGESIEYIVLPRH